jgi:hypothetical protein
MASEMRNGSAAAGAGETASEVLAASVLPTPLTRDRLTHVPTLTRRSASGEHTFLPSAWPGATTAGLSFTP